MLTREELIRAENMIKKEMDTKGFIDDSTYLENSFLHKVGHEFYKYDDSSEKADAIYAEILSIMEGYKEEVRKLDNGELRIIYLKE